MLRRVQSKNGALFVSEHRVRDPDAAVSVVPGNGFATHVHRHCGAIEALGKGAWFETEGERVFVGLNARRDALQQGPSPREMWETLLLATLREVRVVAGPGGRRQLALAFRAQAEQVELGAELGFRVTVEARFADRLRNEVEYLLSVTYDGRMWDVMRKYADFVAAHEGSLSLTTANTPGCVHATCE